MAKRLTDEGLHVVALERGPDRDTQPNFAYPRVVDELEGSVHWRFFAKSRAGNFYHSP